MKLEAKHRLTAKDAPDLTETVAYIRKIMEADMSAFNPKVLEDRGWIRVDFKLPGLGKTSLHFDAAVSPSRGTANVSGLDKLEDMIPLAIARAGEDLNKQTLSYVRKAAEGHRVLGEFYTALEKALFKLSKKTVQAEAT